jgi:hypothetical protein
MISKMASKNNAGRHLCFKLDHAQSSIRLIQDHDFDINYKTRNRNPDSETRFGFRIKKCAPDYLFGIFKLFFHYLRIKLF